MILDVAGLVLFVGFFALVTWHGRLVLDQSWISGSRSQSALETPVIVPQVLWFAGLVLFFVVGVVLLVEALRLVFTGNVPGAVHLIGTRSAEEEVEEEIAALLAARKAGDKK